MVSQLIQVMAEMVGGVALDKGLGMITGLVSKAWKFKTTRTKLQSTIQNLTPVVKKMKQQEEESNLPTEDTEKDLGDLLEGEQLVSKYSNVPWWKCCWLPFYQDKLQAMYLKLERSRQLMQPRIAVAPLLAALSRGVRRQINGVFKAPIRPALTVGFDVPLKELRNRLLESGTSVSVLTGSPGSGKTTLATMLCWDKQVEGNLARTLSTFSSILQAHTTLTNLFVCLFVCLD